MMNFALLGDLHIGVKNDDEWIHTQIYNTLKWFTDDCKAKGITHCLQAGDWFDVRKGISQTTMQFMREKIAPMFQETFDVTYVIVGNHDLKLKEHITPNSCREVLGGLDKFHIIEEPETVVIDGLEVDMIPWICKSNKDEIEKFIKESTSDYCMGHFELTGFYYYKGMKSSGDDPGFLEKYKQVWSGHYHTISSGSNVQYLGTPYTITLGDANDPRGYWMFNEETEEIEFNQNPVTNHYRVYFDADKWKYGEKEIGVLFTDKTVKLVIEKSHSDTNKVNIDKILDDFERVCHEFTFEYKESILSEDGDEDIDVKNTFDIIKEQIELLDETSEVKERVLKIFSGLYAETASAE